MDYNTIAYKVENGIIVNATVVDVNAPLEEGFVKREWPLKIGDVESFGDFYSPETTQEQIDREKELLIRQCNSTVERVQDEIEVVNLKTANLTSQIASLQQDDVSLPTLVEQKQEEELKVQKMNEYIEYLNVFKSNIKNPMYQRPKRIEEI